MRDCVSFVLELARQASAPANAAVGAGHVRDHRARRRGFEAVRLRDHVGDLIAAPTVSLNADGLFVDEALVDHRLNRRQHALQRALARIADRVDDVRHEDQIAVADVVRRIDRSARARDCESWCRPCDETFVDVHDHRVLLFRIEVVRFQQQALQRHAVGIFETNQFAVPQLNWARCASPLLTFFRSLKSEPVTQTSGNSSKRDAVNINTSASFALVGLLKSFAAIRQLLRQAAIDASR